MTAEEFAALPRLWAAGTSARAGWDNDADGGRGAARFQHARRRNFWI